MSLAINHIATTVTASNTTTISTTLQADAGDTILVFLAAEGMFPQVRSATLGSHALTVTRNILPVFGATIEVLTYATLSTATAIASSTLTVTTWSPFDAAVLFAFTVSGGPMSWDQWYPFAYQAQNLPAGIAQAWGVECFTESTAPLALAIYGSAAAISSVSPPSGFTMLGSAGVAGPSNAQYAGMAYSTPGVALPWADVSFTLTAAASAPIPNFVTMVALAPGPAGSGSMSLSSGSGFPLPLKGSGHLVLGGQGVPLLTGHRSMVLSGKGIPLLAGHGSMSLLGRVNPGAGSLAFYSQGAPRITGVGHLYLIGIRSITQSGVGFVPLA